ncbi:MULTISPECIES: aldo/keto reductase [Thauera]|uniref:Aldo/keto reductase n=1 Tax=Thauera aminoaromatica TaxID=164330 RepID=A0A5C7SBA4_THASP|nr:MULTISPECIES: aldo/keto reductase [Thauera]KIN92246.1 aldo/keto reductase family protein [Thauera sp. SWB20]TXH80639.1 MAG: aldo/keto reductase [Thauera aminoaromatica]
MKITPAPLLTLSNGVEMPRLGLGTWPMNDSEAAETVALALDMGYRLIDTAENYENERGVGEGIRRAGVARGELFVTTKFNRKWHSVEGARQACEASLERLGLDYIDLFLVHWPNPDQGRYVEAFEGLVKLQEAGLVRAIGTSNFKPAHLQQLFDRGLCPQVNQIHLDPWHARSDHIEVHEARGIVTESWSPLGRANAMLADPTILDVARRHGRTPAQVILRWHTQLGYVPIPKSSNPTRLAENLDVFGFELSAEELAAIGALDRPDPEMLDSDVFGH